MINREEFIGEQLLREAIQKLIKKKNNKSIQEEKSLRKAIRGLLREETAKKTIYPYTSLNVLSDFIKNQVYKPTSNFKSAYMTLSSSKEDRERFLQHILDLAREDMKRMDMNMEPLKDPSKMEKEQADKDELEATPEEEVDTDEPIIVTMQDLDSKGGLVGDEDEEPIGIPGEENLQEDEEEPVIDPDNRAERDAVRNYANETYKGFGSSLRTYYEKVPDNIVKVNVEGEERQISEKELFSLYLEKNLIAHSQMAEQYMDSESTLTTDVPDADSSAGDLEADTEEASGIEDLDLDI